MDYQEKLKFVEEFVQENITDIEQFCVMFDVTLDDLINNFPDKMVKHYGKVSGDYEEDEEDEWDGFQVD